MNINILELITSKINELEQSGTIEELITKAVEDSVVKTIKDTFGGYSFQRDIEKKLKNEVDGALDKVSLASYNQIIVNRMTEVIRSIQGDTLASELEEHFKKIFIGCEGFKMSEIFEAVRNDFKGDGGDSYDEHFTFIMNDDGLFVRFYFDEKPGKKNYECGYRISIYINDKVNRSGDICGLVLDGADFGKGLTQISTLSEWEKKLLNAFLQKTKIECDIADEDDVDTSLYDEY